MQCQPLATLGQHQPGLKLVDRLGAGRISGVDPVGRLERGPSQDDAVTIEQGHSERKPVVGLQSSRVNSTIGRECFVKASAGKERLSPPITRSAAVFAGIPGTSRRQGGRFMEESRPGCQSEYNRDRDEQCADRETGKHNGRLSLLEPCHALLADRSMFFCSKWLRYTPQPGPLGAKPLKPRSFRCPRDVSVATDGGAQRGLAHSDGRRRNS